MGMKQQIGEKQDNHEVDGDQKVSMGENERLPEPMRQNNLIPAMGNKQVLLGLPRMQVEGGDMNKLTRYRRMVLGTSKNLQVLSEANQLDYLQRPCQPLFARQGGSAGAEKPSNLPRKNRGSDSTSAGKTQFPLVSYMNQGDPSYYTVDNMLQRYRLRYTEKVSKWLQAWWEVAKTRLTSSVSGVVKQTYVRVMSVLHLVLSGVSENQSDVRGKHADVGYVVEVSDRRFGEAMALAELDWERDIRLQGISDAEFLKRDTWVESIFELSDIWCDSAVEKEYCQFLAFCLAHYVIAVETRNPGEIESQLRRMSSAHSEEESSHISDSDAGDASSIARTLETPFCGLKPKKISFVGVHWRNIELPDDILQFLVDGKQGANALLQKALESLKGISRDYFSESARYIKVNDPGSNTEKKLAHPDGTREASEGSMQRCVVQRSVERPFRQSLHWESCQESIEIVSNRWKVGAGLEAAGLCDSIISNFSDTHTVQDFIKLGQWTQDQDGRLYNQSLIDELRLVVEEFRRRQRRKSAKVRYLQSSERVFSRRNAHQEARKVKKSRNGSAKESNGDAKESGVSDDEDDTSSLSKRSVSKEIAGNRERKGLNLYWENKIDVRDWELLGVRPLRKTCGEEISVHCADGGHKSILIGSDPREWQWVAEIPVDHRYNPVNEDRNDSRVVRSRKMQRIGVFPDQISAALAYDVAVRCRRLHCGLGLDPQYVNNSALQEDEIETVKQKHRENKAKALRMQSNSRTAPGRANRRPPKAAPAGSSPGASEGSTDSSDQEAGRNVPQHSAYTNFSIAGQLLEPPDHLRTPRRYWPASLRPVSQRFWQHLENYLGKEVNWEEIEKGDNSQDTTYSVILQNRKLRSTGLWKVVVRDEFTTEASLDFYLELTSWKNLDCSKRACQNSSHFRKRRRKCRTANEWVTWQRRYHRALVTEVIQWHRAQCEAFQNTGEISEETYQLRKIASEGLANRDEDKLLSAKGHAFVKIAQEVSNLSGLSPEEILKTESGWVEGDTNCRYRTLFDRQTVINSLKFYGAFSPAAGGEDMTYKESAAGDEGIYENQKHLSYSALYLIQSSGVPARLAVATWPISAVEDSSSADFIWPGIPEQEEGDVRLGTLRDLNNLLGLEEQSGEGTRATEDDGELDWHANEITETTPDADDVSSTSGEASDPTMGATSSEVSATISREAQAVSLNDTNAMASTSTSPPTAGNVTTIPEVAVKTVVSRARRERDSRPNTMPSPEPVHPSQDTEVLSDDDATNRDRAVGDKHLSNDSFSSETYALHNAAEYRNFIGEELSIKGTSELQGKEKNRLSSRSSDSTSELASDEDLHRICSGGGSLDESHRARDEAKVESALDAALPEHTDHDEFRSPKNQTEIPLSFINVPSLSRSSRLGTPLAGTGFDESAWFDHSDDFKMDEDMFYNADQAPVRQSSESEATHMHDVFSTLTRTTSVPETTHLPSTEGSFGPWHADGVAKQGLARKVSNLYEFSFAAALRKEENRLGFKRNDDQQPNLTNPVRNNAQKVTVTSQLQLSRRHSTSSIPPKQADLGSHSYSDGKYIKTSEFSGGDLDFSHSMKVHQDPSTIQFSGNLRVSPSLGKSYRGVTLLPDNLQSLWNSRKSNVQSVVGKNAKVTFKEMDNLINGLLPLSFDGSSTKDASHIRKNMNDGGKGAHFYYRGKGSGASYRSGMTRADELPYTRENDGRSPDNNNQLHGSSQNQLGPVSGTSRNRFFRDTTQCLRLRQSYSPPSGQSQHQARSKTSIPTNNASPPHHRQSAAAFFRDIHMDNQPWSTCMMNSNVFNGGGGNNDSICQTPSYEVAGDPSCGAYNPSQQHEPAYEIPENAGYTAQVERGSALAQMSCSGLEDLNRVEEVSRNVFHNKVKGRLKRTTSALAASKGASKRSTSALVSSKIASKDASSPTQGHNLSSFLEDPSSVRSESGTYLVQSEGSAQQMSETVSQSMADEALSKILEKKNTPARRPTKRPLRKQRMAKSGVSRASRARLVRSAR